MRAGRQILAFSALALMATGCGASRPVKYYVLDPEGSTPKGPAAASVRFPFTLLVARLSASHLYRDDRLVYGSGPVQLGTYEYQRWAEPAVEMLQDALIASLRASGQYRGVSTIGSNLHGDYIVRGRLVALDEIDKPEVAARFSIELELFDTHTGLSVWSDSYTHDEPVGGKTVPDVVEALDKNVRAGLEQLTESLNRYFASQPGQPGSAR
jgi:ABC-type uncharacterized transport system auxiliary subunit